MKKYSEVTLKGQVLVVREVSVTEVEEQIAEIDRQTVPTTLDWMFAEQMEVVIARSADLAAGKDTLVGAVERVTAALRVEAEASELLGLTLNENYVKSWYEASAAYGPPGKI